MSKSLGNTILLSDSAEEIQKKMRTAVTDTLKVRKNDPDGLMCVSFFHIIKNLIQVKFLKLEMDVNLVHLAALIVKRIALPKIADSLARFARSAHILKVIRLK